MGLYSTATPTILEASYNSNWVFDEEINSTSGFVFTLACGAISQKSFKQTCIAKSKIKHKFIALELMGHDVE